MWYVNFFVFFQDNETNLSLKTKHLNGISLLSPLEISPPPPLEDFGNFGKTELNINKY